MNPNYSNSSYGPIRYSLNRKRQIINAQLNELHAMQLDMIDQAVEASNLAQANEIINYIRSL